MNDAMGFFGTGFGIVVMIFLLILSIMWFLLPFAIIAIQKRVTELVDIQRKVLHELQKLNTGVSDITDEKEL